jgi:hypothetical protein
MNLVTNLHGLPLELNQNVAQEVKKPKKQRPTTINERKETKVVNNIHFPNLPACTGGYRVKRKRQAEASVRSVFNSSIKENQKTRRQNTITTACPSPDMFDGQDDNHRGRSRQKISREGSSPLAGPSRCYIRSSTQASPSQQPSSPSSLLHSSCSPIARHRPYFNSEGCKRVGVIHSPPEQLGSTQGGTPSPTHATSCHVELKTIEQLDNERKKNYDQEKKNRKSIMQI